MKKHNLLVLLAATGLLGGCAATLTPTGDIYTEALLPVDTTTVIVESAPLVAYAPRPVGPAIGHHPRGGLRPGPYFGPCPGPSVRYGAPGQHRSPGQHRAPGVRGPRAPHHGSYGIPSFRGQRTSGQQARPGKTQHGPQAQHGPRQNAHGPNSRGPR